MAKKKKKQSIADMLSRLSDSLEEDVVEESKVPSIIEFVESEEYLGMESGPSPIYLYPVQKLVLKVFYRGTIGNEDLEITDEEIEICKKLGLIAGPQPGEKYSGSERGDVLGKYFSGDIFNELVLIWGRRSGKDFMASIMALYEAMKLLEVPGGDPYSYYNTAPGEPITILTIANSKGQAGISFNMVSARLRNSKYFQDKFVPEGLVSGKISLLTKVDKANNKRWEERGEQTTKGSVVIEVGHSNSDTLLGKGCFVLILDEVASYTIGSGGAGSGERIYTALSPTISTYFRRIPVTDESGRHLMDENGELEYVNVYDGKKISISSPRGKEGKLWQLYENDPHVKKQLMCRLATWQVNPYQPEKALREQESTMSDNEFYMEFGGEFSGTAGENMFDRDMVVKAFDSTLSFRQMGIPGRVYFAHLDPATNSHNYALVIVHVEVALDPVEHKSESYVVVDHVKYWSPKPGVGISISEVDEYMVGLKKLFHLGLVTYDQWNSSASIAKLRKHGIPAIKKQFNRRYKMEIYTELENLLNSGRIRIPEHVLLKNEMIELQRKFNMDTGFRVYPKQDGDGCKTDDITDALAGACYNAISAGGNNLPKGKMVNMGISPQSNNVSYRSMQGTTYGSDDWGVIDRMRGGDGAAKYWKKRRNT